MFVNPRINSVIRGYHYIIIISSSSSSSSFGAGFVVTLGRLQLTHQRAR